MFSMFFTDLDVVDYKTVTTCDTQFFMRYFNEILNEGIYIAPSQFEAGFISTVHFDDEICKTLEASKKALEKAKQS